MLNKDGEVIEGLPGDFRVVPNGKWWDSKLFETAANDAAQVFANEGAIVTGFDDTQVLTQEYPTTGQLAFVFEHSVRGRTMLHPFVFALPPEMVRELTALGKWQPAQKDIH